MRWLDGIAATFVNHLTLYRSARLMADIEDLKIRSAALAPRVQAALMAENAAGAATGQAQAAATMSANLDVIDANLAAVEAMAPPLQPAASTAGQLGQTSNG